MKGSLLIVTNADPRTSGRVAEAVRIAAGVGAWKKMPVNLLLAGPATRAAGEFPEELVDGNLIADYLEAIHQHGGKIYVWPKTKRTVSAPIPVEVLDSIEPVLKETQVTIRL